MDLFTKAKELGIQTEFIDGQGHRHVTDEAALKIIIDALPVRAPRRFLGGTVVMRSGRPARTELKGAATLPLRWKIIADLEVIAQGEAKERVIVWPPDLPVGSYWLHLSDAASFTEEAPLIVAPSKAFGGDFDRCWLLAVQLYGVRSARNWGIGDFTDLEGLIELASHLGADGIGLNPLHALFDDRPGDCSPYSPNSRLFLNALYIDVERVPGFQPAAEDQDALARLRQSEIVDYAAVAGLKWRALRFAFDAFRADPDSEARQDFEEFCSRARAAVVALRLLRGAQAQIQQTVVGMAGRVAAARRGQLRGPASGAGQGRDRIRRIRAVDRRPAARGLPGSRQIARHEGRSLSRCRGRRATRRLRCLERAGGDLPPSRRRRAAGPAERRGPELGTGGLQRRRPRNQVVRTVPRDASGLDAARRRDPARPCAGPEAALSGAARFCRKGRRLCADAVRGAAGGDRAGKHGAPLRGDRRGSRHRAGRLSRSRWPIGASGRTR